MFSWAVHDYFQQGTDNVALLTQRSVHCTNTGAVRLLRNTLDIALTISIRYGRVLRVLLIIGTNIASHAMTEVALFVYEVSE